ncbi:type A2 lantipeptide [Streptomyces sp. NBC_00201]|nr:MULTISPECIES: type A2 lantipeptide [unclassified Streptomyces]MCX5053333.1 type A2 lantipeptide [Streptomyces sp. NBC_00474]MCX5059400.1 type A2 lantipeptide [Streptomyces sp. NBC_00452]MCX5243955.1 type A2 lantipeptide [Streptomyces sp. NBC_00201]
MNLASQVETTEMSDAEMENVSGGLGLGDLPVGGLAAGGSGGLSLQTPLGDIAGGLVAGGSLQGLTAGASLQTPLSA